MFTINTANARRPEHLRQTWRRLHLQYFQPVYHQGGAIYWKSCSGTRFQKRPPSMNAAVASTIFTESGTSFPIDNALFDAIEPRLANTDECSMKLEARGSRYP